MSVTYLSEPWAEELNARLSADESLRKAVGKTNATIQQVITDGPQGEQSYWLRLADGTASAGLGQIENAEITISQSYDTAVQLNKGELDGQRAFFLDKVKFRGKITKMMQLRGPLSHVQRNMAAIDTEY
jgi:putative sterol carrier protein